MKNEMILWLLICGSVTCETLNELSDARSQFINDKRTEEVK